MMKRIRKMACLFAMVTGIPSCVSRHPELSQYAITDNPPGILTSIPQECGGPSDPKWHDFHWAASSRDFKEAAQRWQTVLQRHYAGPDPFEDGADFGMWLLAKRELMRALYVSGNVKEGDVILNELKTLQ
jgi:hypothetical protein